MKSLQSTISRGAILTVAALSVFTMTACSAGQISQTADQVAAVDGSSAETEGGEIAVRDVTIIIDDQHSDAGLKFTVMNQDKTNSSHSLRSVSVDGKPVMLGSISELDRHCSIVGGLSSELDQITEPEDSCVQHTATSFQNPGLAYGSTAPVEFVFDTSTVRIDAPVSAPTLPSGENNRDTADHSAH